jgi:nucleotide-binding universal stress UspA family protein
LTHLRTAICSWSALVAAAALHRSCWVRSAIRSFITRAARSSSCQQGTDRPRHGPLAAAALGDASDTMMAHPLALQPRNLVEIGVDKNTTVVFPAPLMSTIEELGSFLARELAASTQHARSGRSVSLAPATASPDGATARRVIAWEFPTAYGYPMPVSDVNWEELAGLVVTDVIADIRNFAGQVEIGYKVVEGNPAQVPVDESADAELLVVGSRGHGDFVEALLGSVGQHCAHHAKSPVVVIRDSVAAEP